MAPKTDNIVIFNGTALAFRTSKKICTKGEVEGPEVGSIIGPTSSSENGDALGVVVGNREKRMEDGSCWLECELGSIEKGEIRSSILGRKKYPDDGCEDVCSLGCVVGCDGGCVLGKAVGCVVG